LLSNAVRIILLRQQNVDEPPPNIGASSSALIILHPLGNFNILCTMVSSHSAWGSMDRDSIKEEVENSICTIVIVGSDGRHHSRFAVYEAVNYNFPPN
jgi:hypothetical protein